jgi:hypothetical protein
MTSQEHEHIEARDGLFVDHTVRKTDKALHDTIVDSNNEYLNGSRKIEILGITREAMDTRIAELGGESLRDHLLQHGVGDGEEPDRNTFLTVEATRETDEKGKWYLTYNIAKETAVTTCIDQLIPNLRKNEPKLFPKLTLGGKRTASFVAYTNTLRNRTPPSSNPKSNGGPNRNSNKYNNSPSVVTIAYDDESFPEISTTATAPSSHPPRTPLTKLNGKNTPANASRKKDTYASRAAAASLTKNTSKTTNKTSDTARGKPRSDAATTPKQHSQEENGALLQRMAVFDTRMAAIESKMIHQGATTARMELSTSKDMKTLGELIASLTEQVAALVVQLAPTHSNKTIDNTARPLLHNKRGLESSPSPNGATKHPNKRKTRLAPVQLDGDFADDGDSQSMDDAEDQSYGQSRSNSPDLGAEISEGSEDGGMHTQPGSQES